MFLPSLVDTGVDRYYAAAGAAALKDQVSGGPRNSVTLVDLLGKNYSSSVDASSGLEDFIAELAPAGIAIRDPDGMEVLLSSGVALVSGTVLDLSPATTLRKASFRLSDIVEPGANKASPWVALVPHLLGIHERNHPQIRYLWPDITCGRYS